jgi:hypothetical protein
MVSELPTDIACYRFARCETAAGTTHLLGHTWDGKPTDWSKCGTTPGTGVPLLADNG